MGYCESLFSRGIASKNTQNYLDHQEVVVVVAALPPLLVVEVGLEPPSEEQEVHR